MPERSGPDVEQRARYEGEGVVVVAVESPGEADDGGAFQFVFGFDGLGHGGRFNGRIVFGLGGRRLREGPMPRITESRMTNAQCPMTKECQSSNAQGSHPRTNGHTERSVYSRAVKDL